MTRLLIAIGNRILKFVQTCGEITELFVQTVFWIFRAKPRFKQTIEQMLYIGFESIPIVLLTATFIGMIFVLQTGYQLGKFGATLYAGGISAIAFAREIGPVFTAWSIAARVGASIAAEIGTMQVTEQIDAMKTLATDPVKYLVVPRFIGAMVMVPILTILAILVGILGGWGIAITNLQLSSQTYISNVQDFLLPKEIYAGLLKTPFFGMIIVIIGCYQGFKTVGGAEGVGRATRNAVVISTILIIFADYIMGAFILALWK